MIHVRDLLKRVTWNRPDLSESRGEALALWAIRETVRSVCRETGLAIEIQTALPLLAETHNSAIASAGNEVLKVLRVEVANLPGEVGANPAQYLGVFDATNGNITPAYSGITKVQTGNSTSFPTHGFFICSAAGGVDVDSVTTAWQEGDIIQANGAQWVQIKSDNWRTIDINSKQAIEKWNDHPQARRGFPLMAAQMADTLYWYPPTSQDAAYRLTLSVVPNLLNWTATPAPTVNDMDAIPLPVEAETTIVAGASEMMCSAPGPMMDMKKAMVFKADYIRGLSGLKAVALLGNHRAWLQPPNILGRDANWRIS